MDALLPLERFAALSAEIESGSSRDAILDREGLSPEQWEAFEAMWRARIEDDLSHGSFELTNRYNAAFVASRAALQYGTPSPEPGAVVGYAPEPLGQPVPTPRMAQGAPAVERGQQPPWLVQASEVPGTMVDPAYQPPPPTPRMLQAPEPVALVADPAHQPPPPTPRMLQAPEARQSTPGVPVEHERVMTKTQPMQVVTAARMAQPADAPPRGTLPPLPRPPPSPSRPEIAAHELGDRPTPVPDTLRPGMALPAGPPGDRLTPPPSTQEERLGSFDEASPPSSRPPSTPRQEALEGPRLDGLPFRPAPAASDAAPRSTGDLSGVLPFKPAVSAPAVNAPAVSAPAVSAPAVSAPAMSAPAVSNPPGSPPAVSSPQSPWSGAGTGTVKMSAQYAPPPQPVHAPQPSEPEIEAPAPISTHAIPAGYGEPAEIGPPVLTGPGSLTPAPIVFPFALWRRTAEPQAYAAPVYAPQPHYASAPVAQAHPPQAPSPHAQFPLALPAAGPVNAPLLPPPNAPPILTAPASTHLAPPSARQTLPPNFTGASPVTPFKASPEPPAMPPGSPPYAQGPSNLAQTGFSQQPAYASPPVSAAAPPYPASPPAAAVPPPQPSQPLAVPAVLGASTSRLSLEQYASLSAEIAISPGTSAAVRARYGLDENSHVAETGLWQRRFSADKDLFTRYSALYQSYREWFSRSAR